MSNLSDRRNSPRRRIEAGSSVALRVVLFAYALLTLTVFVFTGNWAALLSTLGMLNGVFGPRNREIGGAA